MHQAIARGKLHTQGGAVGEDVKVEGERKEETYLLLAALALLSVVLLVGAMVLDHLSRTHTQGKGREGGGEGGHTFCSPPLRCSRLSCW